MKNIKKARAKGLTRAVISDEDMARFFALRGNPTAEIIDREVSRLKAPKDEAPLVDNVHNDSIQNSLYSLPARDEHGFMGRKKMHRYYFSDHQMIQDIEDAIKHESALDNVNDTIQVNVEDGIVTLDGAVYSRTQKRLAEEAACSVAGYGKINNYLLVLDE